jgi:hypothetical protein
MHVGTAGYAWLRLAMLLTNAGEDWVASILGMVGAVTSH